MAPFSPTTQVAVSTRCRWSTWPQAHSLALLYAAGALMLADALRMAYLPERLQTAFMDGFEAFIAGGCAVLCLLTASRCSRFGRGVWSLTAAFFTLTAVADLQDFYADLFHPGDSTLLMPLVLLGWCAYLPLALLVFYPLERDDGSSWNWLSILDFLQVTLVVAAGFFRFIYLPHHLLQQGWNVGGTPEMLRNLLLSCGLLLRSLVDPWSRARAFYRRSGGAFALLTFSLIFFAGRLHPVSDWMRPAALLALGLMAAAWKEIPNLEREQPRMQWLFPTLPLLGPVFLLGFARNTPVVFAYRMQVALMASLAIFLMRASLAEYYRLAGVRLQRQSEGRFRAVIEQAPVAMGFARGGLYVYANPMYLRTFGFDRLDEVVGHKVIEHVAPQYRAEILEHIRQRDEGAVPLPDEYETMACRKDGTLFPVLVAVTEVQLADGPATLGFQFDITERKKAEQTIRESEARFRTLIEKAPVAIAISREHQALYGNQSFLEMFGYRHPEDLLGQPVEDFWAPEYRPAILDLIRRRSAGLAAPLEYEGVALKKDGARFPVHVNVSRVELLDGPATMAMMIDVSTRRQAEEAVRRSEAELRSFVDNCPFGIARVSGDRFVSSNPALVRMLGYESQEEIQLLRVSADIDCDSKGPGRLEKELASGDSFSGIELQWMRKDGRRITVRVSGRRVRTREGDDLLEEIVEDITELQALHEQFLQAQKMEAVGRLAGGIAHDFNNVLGIIMGYTELLSLHLGEESPARAHTEEIMKASRRAGALTQQLLAFGRKQVMQRKSLDLNALIKDTEKMLAALVGVQVRLILRLDRALPPVLADAGHLVQVLMNLAVNARDAMPAGGALTITTSRTEAAEQEAPLYPGWAPGSYVAMTVADSGTGMSAEVRNRIFEPFFTTKEEGKGTGLGLATVYGIIRQNEGHIEIESELGIGTCFRIFLPMAESGIAMAPPVEPAVQEKPAHQETILLVEDEAALREFLAVALNRSGYRVLQAGSGSEALALLVQESHIDLLITDFLLPDTRGPQVYRDACQARGEMKVIYMSGYADAATIEAELIHPRSMFLQKPFELRALLDAVTRAFSSPDSSFAIPAAS